jgi:colanic acid/amylovoran biosynthesis glycosyltransferase
VKLAYLTTKFPFGRTETFFRPEVRSLAEHAEVVVIPTRPAQRTARYHDLNGAKPHFIGVFDRSIAARAMIEFARNPRGVLAVLGTLLFARYSPSAKLKNVVLFPKALAVAHDVRALGVDHIHAQWITTPATVAYVAARLTGIPWSITAHQHDIFADNMLAEKVAHASFTRIISARNCGHLQEQIPAALRTRCSVIHLGVELPATTVAPEPSAMLRILCAARLVSWKGHRYLIEALAQMRARGISVRCDLAGEGELQETIEAQIATLGLGEIVRLRGPVRHDVLTAELAAGIYDVSVLASTEDGGEHEGIPIAIMEAMAAGIAVLATHTGSLDELVVPGTGILVPQRDALALADALERLAREPIERTAMAQCGRERVHAEFSTAATTRRLFASIAGSGPAPHPELVGRKSPFLGKRAT